MKRIIWILGVLISLYSCEKEIEPEMVNETKIETIIVYDTIKVLDTIDFWINESNIEWYVNYLDYMDDDWKIRIKASFDTNSSWYYERYNERFFYISHNTKSYWYQMMLLF